MKIEIGDKFIINWKLIKKNYPKIKPCLNPNIEFTINKFSKSGLSVYYHDFRTNKKCNCQICQDIRTEKSIGVHDIIVTQTRIQSKRNLSLKILGI
jgi:hypothetical protein